MYQVDWKNALDLADIREAYCKSVKPCPKCNDVQVQLVGSQVSHGDWKCRRCAHKWQTKPDYPALLNKGIDIMTKFNIIVKTCKTIVKQFDSLSQALIGLNDASDFEEEVEWVRCENVQLVCGS